MDRLIPLFGMKVYPQLAPNRGPSSQIKWKPAVPHENSEGKDNWIVLYIQPEGELSLPHYYYYSYSLVVFTLRGHFRAVRTAFDMIGP